MDGSLTTIADLIFDVVIGDVLQMLKDQDLEHQHQVAGFTTDLAFSGVVAKHRQGIIYLELEKKLIAPAESKRSAKLKHKAAK